MLNLIYNEVFKIFARKKVYVFMILTVGFHLLPLIISTVMQQPMTYNGQSYPVISLESFLSGLLPMLIILLAGDLTASEYEHGTLKLFLVSPVTRTRLLGAKALALIITVIVLLIVNLLAAYGLGILFLGWGDGFEFSKTVLSSSEGIFYTLTSNAVAVIPQMCFAAVILFLSLAVVNGNAFIGVSLGFLVTMQVAANFAAVKPFLISSYFGIYKWFLIQPRWETVISGIAVMLVYGVCFLTAANYILNRKDILT